MPNTPLDISPLRIKKTRRHDHGSTIVWNFNDEFIIQTSSKFTQIKHRETTEYSWKVHKRLVYLKEKTLNERGLVTGKRRYNKRKKEYVDILKILCIINMIRKQD